MAGGNRKVVMAAPRIDDVARLVGDSSRATMLDALMDGRAWTGRELARVAHVTPSTASEHLARLVKGALLSVVPQGRRRYYRIASSDVAHALEALMVLAPPTARTCVAHSAEERRLRRGRTCYDHLAGELGVGLTQALIRSGALRLDVDGAALTPPGAALFERLAIDLGARNPRRALCRPCLDWSERRFHLAGRAGAALANHAFERGWIRRDGATRAVAVSAAGIVAFRDAFGLEWRP